MSRRWTAKPSPDINYLDFSFGEDISHSEDLMTYSDKFRAYVVIDYAAEERVAGFEIDFGHMAPPLGRRRRSQPGLTWARAILRKWSNVQTALTALQNVCNAHCINMNLYACCNRL